jgi:hypothetical protein
MKKLGAGILALAFGVITATPLVAAAQEKTITGKLQDAMCASDGKTDNGDSDACALACAKRGEAMVVVAKDGLYTITGKFTDNKNEKMLPFVAKDVTVTGVVTEKDGKKMIAVSAIDAKK